MNGCLQTLREDRSGVQGAVGRRYTPSPSRRAAAHLLPGARPPPQIVPRSPPSSLWSIPPSEVLYARYTNLPVGEPRALDRRSRSLLPHSTERALRANTPPLVAQLYV